MNFKKREQIKKEKEKIELLKKDDPEKYLVSLYNKKRNNKMFKLISTIKKRYFDLSIL